MIALGYRGDTIRRYFLDMGLRRELTTRAEQTVICPSAEPKWTVELIETGPETMSGGRIKRLAPYLGDKTFMLTWCDGLADIDLPRLLAFHEAHGRLVTLTATHPPARFGRLTLNGDRVTAFQEKTTDPEEWINGAFFVVHPRALKYIDGDHTQWEHEPLRRLAAAGELMAYRHESFWQCMDTLQENPVLNELWEDGAAPWKTWG